MSTGPLSWCECRRGEALSVHQALVALVAWEAYGLDWTYVSRRVGLPLWTLTAAAAGHDIGKAVPCLQKAAVQACRKRKKPSFKYHEYASAVGLYYASLASGSRDARRGLAVASLAALLHHHGMEGRLSPDPSKRAREALGRARNGTCRIEDSSAPESLEAMLESLAASCMLVERLARDLGVRLEPCPLNILKEVAFHARAESGASYASLARGIIRRYYEEYMLDSGVYRALLVVVTAVSVADTVAASFARNGRIGGYACRVLIEKGVLGRVDEILRRSVRLVRLHMPL